MNNGRAGRRARGLDGQVGGLRLRLRLEAEAEAEAGG
jgi:hypothetical protein